MDPWNKPYRYTASGDGQIEIVSFGSDGATGGEGENADVRNTK